jgi:hypothetical protein
MVPRLGLVLLALLLGGGCLGRAADMVAFGSIPERQC